MSNLLRRCLQLALLLTWAASVSAAIPLGERQTLLDLYAATGGSNWLNARGWGGASGTECSWFGIRCVSDGRQDRVVGIDLPRNGLKGSLPALTTLTQLQKISVAGNTLGGSLPALDKLNQLQAVDFSDNQFSGSPPAPPASLQAGASKLCGNRLSSSGDAVIDRSWQRATGVDWLACQAVAATLRSCTVTGDGSLNAGQSGIYRANGQYSDGTNKALIPIEWRLCDGTGPCPAGATSQNASAQSNATTGELTVSVRPSAGKGQITITALCALDAAAPVMGSQSVNIEPAITLTGLSLSGPDTVQAGGSVQLAAEATYSDGSRRQVQPQWRVEDGTLATLSAGGLLTAANLSSTAMVTVSASYSENGVTRIARFELRIAVPQPVSLVLSGPARVQAGGRIALTASVLYDNQSQRSVQPQWQTSDASAAIVGPNGMLVAGAVASDTPVTLTAQWQEAGKTLGARHTLIVTAQPAVPTGLTLSGPTQVQSEGQLRLSASAQYADGSTRQIAPTDYRVSPSHLGIVDGRGLLLVGKVASDTPITVTASYTEGGVTLNGSLTLSVRATPAELRRLLIGGTRGALAAGESLKLSALGVYTDGSRKPVAADWSVSDTVAARIDAHGQITAGAVSAPTPVLISARWQENGIVAQAEYRMIVLPAPMVEAPLRAEIEATGTRERYSLALWLAAANATRAGGYRLYIAALLPPGPLVGEATWLLFNRSGQWQALSWPLAEYLSNVSESDAYWVELLDNFDARLISGTQLYVGYGSSDQEMLAAGRYRLVYVLP